MRGLVHADRIERVLSRACHGSYIDEPDAGQTARALAATPRAGNFGNGM